MTEETTIGVSVVIFRFLSEGKRNRNGKRVKDIEERKEKEGKRKEKAGCTAIVDRNLSRSKNASDDG